MDKALAWLEWGLDAAWRGSGSFIVVLSWWIVCRRDGPDWYDVAAFVVVMVAALTLSVAVEVVRLRRSERR